MRMCDDPPPAVPVKPAREISGEDIINIKQQVSDCIFSVQPQYLMNRWWRFKSTGVSFLNT